jgi:hypothetical protein
MHSNGHTMSNGQSFSGDGTEVECRLIHRILSPVEVPAEATRA